MKPSKYQKAIFKFCDAGKGSAIIQAVAGSGKTTTAIKAIDYCEGSSIFLAFNKSIADELKSRGVNAKTFHGACYMPVMRHFNIKQVDFDKLRRIMKAVLSYEENRMYGSTISKLVGLGKQSGVGILVGYEEFQRLFIEHDMSLETTDADLTMLFNFTKFVFDASIKDHSTCDFDDMLYWVVSEKIQLKKYDNILVDESQDTNAIQREIIKQMKHRKTRILAFGDRFQAIYRFRGSDSNAMDLFRDEFKCKELPLSISYRCAKKIVDYAKKYNQAIEANPTAKDGEVVQLNSWNERVFNSGDLVVCRTTRPLITLAYKLLNKKIPVTVLGRDIGKGLKSLITKCQGEDINQLMFNLDRYRHNEIQRLSKAEKESQIEAVNDKVDTILSLCQSLPVDKNTLEELNSVIDELFTEKKKAVICSTIHKAKGLEAKRVFWLNHQDCPAKWANHPEDKQQELNLCYVAITRAKDSLVLISEAGGMK